MENYYTISIQYKSGKSSVTWCEDYKFDSENETLTLYGSNGAPCGSINMRDKDFKSVDIYNAKDKQNGPIQTILAKAEVI